MFSRGPRSSLTTLKTLQFAGLPDTTITESMFAIAVVSRGFGTRTRCSALSKVARLRVARGRATTVLDRRQLTRIREEAAAAGPGALQALFRLIVTASLGTMS